MARLESVPSNRAQPRAALLAAARKGAPRRYDSPRKLSEKQRRNPFIRQALLRLQGIVERRGDYLRELDNVHASGRRTRLEVFTTLTRVAEQILLRLDLATGVLGWLNEKGEFCLNTQRTIAENAGVSPSRLCRLLALLEQAGYVLRRFERIQVRENGLDLVRTRVLTYFTQKFFRHLGLEHHYAAAQKSARKRRAKQLAAVAALQHTQLVQEGVQKLQRERSRENWRNAQARDAQQERQQLSLSDDFEFSRLCAELSVAIMLAHPDMPRPEVKALAERQARDRWRRAG